MLRTAHDALNDFEYTMIHSITGWPAASINCGFSKSGLPVGMQIAAKPWHDHLVLALAAKAQQVFGIPATVTPKYDVQKQEDPHRQLKARL